MVDLAAELLNRPWPGARVAVFGAAFKPDSDDIRDSPALNVAGRLHLFGAHVTVHDPQAMANARRDWPTLSYADSVSEACRDANLTLVLTEWRSSARWTRRPSTTSSPTVASSTAATAWTRCCGESEGPTGEGRPYRGRIARRVPNAGPNLFT